MRSVLRLFATDYAGQTLSLSAEFPGPENLEIIQVGRDLKINFQPP